VVAVAGNLEPALAHFWYPVATVDQLTAERLVHAEVIGRHYVLVSLDPAAGDGAQVAAFVDACPHRGWPLSQGSLVGSELRCPYHGYRFDRIGRCVAIPAQRPDLPIPARADLQPAAVAVHLGLVWLAPEEPWAPLPELSQFDDPRFSKMVLGPYTWHAGAALINENFLDVSHFPFVHAGTFGLESDAVIPPLHVDRQGWEFSYAYDHQFRNNEEAARLQGVDEPDQHRRIRSRYVPPFATVFEVDYDSGVSSVVVSIVRPIDATRSGLFTLYLSTDFDEDTAEEARVFEEKILFEDQVILEGYRETAMVLDIDAQFHTAADRMTVEFRRVLQDILITTSPATGPDASTIKPGAQP
jgi:phenylpropionate dioxygenase-like ring-hydroxylating dioxygenase large terminal subunit